MSTERKSPKRQKRNNPEMTTHTDSIDLFNDAAFLTSYINSNDILLLPLVSGQITNTSFSDLYQKSRENEWDQVLNEERNKLRLDEKSKEKRIMLNRLINECLTNADAFNQKAENLYKEIKQQMSDTEIKQQMSDSVCTGFQLIDQVYARVDAWKQLQCERRLFYKECNHLCSLLTLQRLMTDYFIGLVDSIRSIPNLLRSGGEKALNELFEHCLITVVQPSGTDCVGVMKYEKVGNDFLAKIKTRIICLLDPDRIGKYLKLENVGVTLYLKDRTDDPEGDVQSPLQWKIRTVTYNETEERKFWYIELNENDSIKLTKKNSNRKLMYNKKLCQLEFHIIFKLIGINFERSITLNSQLFGLSSHAKYSPEYLTKVFLEEVQQICPNIDRDTHIHILKRYIYQLHKRISGVEPKLHTQKFINDELEKVYESFLDSEASTTGSVPNFDLNIYENILRQIFTQIRFLGNHLFLSMMYCDSLFLGICKDTVDDLLNNNKTTKTGILMRFAVFKEQETPDNPNIIFAIYNNRVLKSRITHSYFITDMCTCICEAAENGGNHLQVFDYNNKIVHFGNFSWYYDHDLSRDNLIQTKNEIQYFPLRTLLQNPIRNNQVQQQMMTYTFNLSGQFSANTDLTTDAIVFLERQFANWCGMHNIQGLLFGNSINFDELFNENNSEE